MRTILSITRYDLIRLFKDRNLAVFTLIMPVVIMSVLSLAITTGEPIIRLDVVDNDQSSLSKAFIEQLEAVGGDSLVVCVYDRENSDDCDLSKDDAWSDVGKERVEEGDTSGVILIPAGFGEGLQRGESVALEYRSNDSLNAPTIVTNMINTARNRVGSSVVVAQLAYDPELATLTGTTGTTEIFTVLYAQAEQQWQNAPARIEEESSGEETEIGTGANQSVPGVSSMFLLFTLLNAASVLVSERNSGTLQRLFTLPIPKYQVVVGKMLTQMVYAGIQFIILYIVGGFLGAEFGSNYLAIALLVIAFLLCGGALGFALATFVKNENQAGAIASLAGFILAPLGGAWWPLDIVPDFMRIIGHLSPIAWVMDGFQDLIYYDGTVLDVLPEVGVLLAMAAVFGIIGVARFRYE